MVIAADSINAVLLVVGKCVWIRCQVGSNCKGWKILGNGVGWGVGCTWLMFGCRGSAEGLRSWPCFEQKKSSKYQPCIGQHPPFWVSVYMCLSKITNTYSLVLHKFNALKTSRRFQSKPFLTTKIVQPYPINGRLAHNYKVEQYQ